MHCNFLTAEALCDIYAKSLSCKIFTNEEPFSIGSFSITAFGVAHDASDPVAFRIDCDGFTIAFCTDLGFIHPGIVHYLRDLDALVIESNHDVAMVRSSKRPDLYKQRVLSRCGHISNKECARLLECIYTPRLQHVALGHLSEDCNEEALALAECREGLFRAKEKWETAESTSCNLPHLFALPSSTPSDWTVLEKNAEKNAVEKNTIMEKALETSS